MRFLIIILCLLSERYMIHHMQKVRKTWLHAYTDLIRRFLPLNVLDSSPINLYLCVLLTLLSISGIFSLAHHTNMFFILYFVFEFSVFYLCLGEHNLFFINVGENKNNYLKNNDYIIAINEEIIAIIIWFFAFGPAGAILYRVTLEFSKMQQFENNIMFIKNLLDWIPTRITALLLLMVGHFQPGFSLFIQKVLSPVTQNQNFLTQIAAQALNTNSIENIEISKLETIYSHACLLLLFFLSILMIGKFL